MRVIDVCVAECEGPSEDMEEHEDLEEQDEEKMKNSDEVR